MSLINLSLAQKINQSESKVEFKIGTMGLSSTTGEIKGMKGIVNFDENSLSQSNFDVTISPNTVDTDNKKRDEHLKKKDFFNVDKYLTISFKSSSITKRKSGYLAKGQLTILNTTKEIELPFTVSKTGTRRIFTGEIEVNRFDYNLASEEYKSSFMVGEVADVKIICVTE